MFKNQYDTDISTWSPAGRLYQVEYATEAVNQGSAAVGAKSRTHVVLAALKRSPTAKLSSFQEKVFLIDGHCGMAIAGLVADGRHLARFMRIECQNHRYMQDTPLPILRLADMLGEKHQRHTQVSDKRPFGVGLLIAGVDSQGPHLVQTLPTGDVLDFKATAMGVRSQSARTYLERHFESFPDCALDELVLHALRALATTAPEGVSLTPKNTSIAIVGAATPFTILTDEAAARYLDGFKLRPEDIVAADEDEDGAAAAGGAAAAPADEPEDLAE